LPYDPPVGLQVPNELFPLQGQGAGCTQDLSATRAHSQTSNLMLPESWHPLSSTEVPSRSPGALPRPTSFSLDCDFLREGTRSVLMTAVSLTTNTQPDTQKVLD
jgi:hypothetical protein